MTVDEGCSKGMVGTAAVLQALTGAARLIRGLIEQRRHARGALKKGEVHRADWSGGARIA
jgi:hypothetical protein